ncbi:TetR/AcrR family transcriptional regulator [Actinoplanes subtropicus]|uniref:TetR/AcrR family transcriptional regulator n=1 Tax=Actinoplanes subtropicus TaxID=543632 RepID=UPI000A73C9FC|nr:helix-turn-helix domain-containing protein [Actinoplanes subtropicus]
MSEQVPHLLRADARENRDRVLDSARALFAEHGLGVTMRQVARRAGVGPATLYRRFPTKQVLVEAALADEVRACRGIVEAGCAAEDPWLGFGLGLASGGVRAHDHGAPGTVRAVGAPGSSTFRGRT